MTMVVRLPDLLFEMGLARSSNSTKKALQQYLHPKLLILDEWLLVKCPPEAQYCWKESTLDGTFETEEQDCKPQVCPYCVCEVVVGGLILKTSQGTFLHENIHYCNNSIISNPQVLLSLWASPELLQKQKNLPSLRQEDFFHVQDLLLPMLTRLQRQIR